MLDPIGALTILQAVETADNPAHSLHIVKSVRQVLETCAIVERLKMQPFADHSLSKVFEQLAAEGARGLAHFLIAFQPDQNYIPFFETLESIHKLIKDARHRQQDLQAAKYYQHLLGQHLTRLKLQSNMDIVENISQIRIRGKQSLEDGVFRWEQDAGHPERLRRADNRQSQGSVTPTISLGREEPSTSTRFSDLNPFRKHMHNLSTNLPTLSSHEGEPQQGITSTPPRHAPPNIHDAPLMQQSSTFLPSSGHTHPVLQPLQRALLSQPLPVRGRSRAESLNGAASSDKDVRTSEQVGALRAPMPWSTMLGLQPSSTTYATGHNPIDGLPWNTRGLSGTQYFWPHGGSPAPFPPPQPFFSAERVPTIIGNHNTIHLTCHNRDSGNATFTTTTDSANNSSSQISGNTSTFTTL